MTYHPSNARRSTKITTAAYDDACNKLYKVPGNCNVNYAHTQYAVPARTVAGVTIPAREKSHTTEAYPLCWSPYQPVAEVPVGQDRMTSKADWPAAHLINGKLGGPGVNWNLAPVTRQVNNGDMPKKYERKLTDLVLKGMGSATFYWFTSETNYYKDSDNPSIGHYSDFVQSIDVSYGEARPNPTGSGWILDPPIASPSVDVPGPTSSDLAPGRGSG